VNLKEEIVIQRNQRTNQFLKHFSRVRPLLRI
jgi:hypothetical protein